MGEEMSKLGIKFERGFRIKSGSYRSADGKAKIDWAIDEDGTFSAEGDCELPSGKEAKINYVPVSTAPLRRKRNQRHKIQ